jgi:heme exporter protein D
MHWESWSDFVAMGGYATFVWGSYCVTAVLLAAEVILVVRRHRTLRRQRGLTAQTRPGSAI